MIAAAGLRFIDKPPNAHHFFISISAPRWRISVPYPP